MTRDRWARWLLNHRDGDCAAFRAQVAPDLAAFRDGVLDRADLQPDDVLLDVGCGTGLIGFGALERLGPAGRVIFSDVSTDLLQECREASGGDERCTFVQAAAENLAAVADASVDVVTTRSVLIYCEPKAAAFAEFYRVLRSGGRLCIFEPINRFAHQYRPDSLFGFRDTPVDDLLAKIAEVYRRGTGPAMVGFDERDLIDWAAAAGFTAVELDYRAQLDVPAPPIPDWQALQRVAPNPLAPRYGEVIAAVLTQQERERLDTYLNTAVTAATPTRRTLATAFLRAVRP